MKKITNKYILWFITIMSIIIVSLLLYFTLLRIDRIFVVIRKIILVFLPIIYGFGIAYLINPLMNFFESKVFKKIRFLNDKFSRFLSLFVTSLIFIGVLLLFIFVVIPQLVDSIEIFVNNIPDYFDNFKLWILDVFDGKPSIQKYALKYYDNIFNFTKKYIINLFSKDNKVILNVSSHFISVFKFIYNFIIGFVIAIYLQVNKELFIAQFKKVLYSFFTKKRVNLLLANLRYVNDVFTNFFVGKIIDSLIIGVICYLFMVVFKMPFPLIIALIVGITNIIPYFGPIIGAVPCSLLILFISPSKFIGFVIFIFILQQFDGNILGPKILGGKVGLNSFWVLFSILIFGGLFGFVGMLVGVPIFSILYAFVASLCNKRLKNRDLPVSSTKYVDLLEIYEDNGKFIYKGDKNCEK